MEPWLWLALALALIFAINLVPAFMPSSWMVMALFYIEFDVPLLPLTLAGAFVSGLGRLLLARVSTVAKRRWLAGRRADLDDLGAFLETRGRYTGLTVFLYALTPLPTNNLFIAAGMVEVSMPWVLGGFWASRMLADTFWVWTADRAYRSLAEVFADGVGSWTALALQLAGVASIALLYLLPWARWLRALIDRGGASARAD